MGIGGAVFAAKITGHHQYEQYYQQGQD